MLQIKNFLATAIAVITVLPGSKAQTPSTITFPSPTPNTGNLSVNSYTRAATKINLTNGFKFGFVTDPNTTNLLNLNVSSNPTFVSGAYMGSATNPQTNICPAIPAIDPGKVVAETKGNFAVSPSGAAIYEIPITLSPGTRGVQPNLSINYNNQSGFGLLGVQWSLSGISCIERTHRIPMHDGSSTGPQLSTTDVYALDGNRLFGLSGTYGQNGTTYYTESESYATITSYNTAGNGPEKFEIKDNNGNTLKYGLANNSSLKGIGSTTTLRWYLNEVSDEFGNYMRYYYKQLTGEVVIDRIEYTGNSGASLTPYNSVNFSYMPMAEKTSYYINGVEFRKTQLLKSIQTKAGNSSVRQYVMDYSWNYATYLSSIYEIDAYGSPLPPTTFCWSKPNDNNGLLNQNTSIFANPNSLDYLYLQAVPADLDGDGFSDYVCYNAPGGSVRIMHNDFLGNMVTGNTISFGTYFNNPNNLHVSSQILSSSVSDEDRDNRQEVLSVVSDMQGYISGTLYGGPSPYSESFYVLKTTIDNTGTAQVVNLGAFTTANPYALNFSPSQFLFQVEDFTGEGDNDNLLISPDEISLRVAANTVYTYPMPNYNSIARPMSFNNDGVRDYIIMDNSNPTSVVIKVITFNGSGFTQLYSNTFSFASGTTSFLNNFTTGDINGDGIDELIYIGPTRDELFICKGNGITFLPPEKLDIFVPLNNSGSFGIALRVEDINNDGKADIITTDSSVQPANSSTNNYFSYLSLGDIVIKGPSYAGNWSYSDATRIFYDKYDTGNGTTFEAYWNRTETANMGNSVRADFNGDGITDVTSFDAPGAERTITNNEYAIVKESITSINTGLRNNIEIHYANLNSEIYVDGNSVAAVYRKRSSTNYSAPLFNYRPEMYAVRQVKTISGANQGVFRETKYMYSDGILHSKGRGFLGFEQVASFDKFTKLGSLRINSFNTTYFLPLSTEVKAGKFQAQAPVNNITDYLIDNNTLISKDEMSYQVAASNSSGYLVTLAGKTMKDYLNSTKTAAAFTYDITAGGRLLTETTNFGWASTIKSAGKIYTYVLNNGYHKISSEKSTETQNGETPYVRSVNYTYDAQGRMTATVNDQLVSALSSSLLTTSYSQFNAFGFPQKTSVSGPNISTRNSEVVYDVTGRFVTKKTDALGNFSEYTYEPLYGNIKEEKSISGLITSYEYDGMGRLASSISPTGVRSAMFYAWEAPVNYPYGSLGVYSIRTETEGNGYSKVYHSGNGDVLRSETQDFAGQMVIADTKYNQSQNPLPMGVKLESTEPHYPSQQKFLTTVFDYETTYFRPSTQTTYSTSSGNASKSVTGLFVQQDYNAQSTDASYVAPFTKTTDQTAKYVTRFTNSAGQLVTIRNKSPLQQQDAAYTYFSCGQPKNITISSPSAPSQNIVHSFSYNDMGQLAQSVDPSLGTRSYAYDVLGEVLKETKPLATFTYQYDVIGRPISRAGGLGTINYSYYSSGTGIQQPQTITGPNSLLEYTYDSFGRMKEEKETVTASGTVLKNNYVYDKYGRETSRTYPGGFITKSSYNAQGVLTLIKDNANNGLWQLQEADALGRIRKYSYGNGIITTNEYDDLNYLTDISHGSLLQQVYTFHKPTGNMISRAYNSSAGTLKEVFSFDDRDRLLQSLQYNSSTNTYFNPNNTTFDVLGNITHKDDAGDLEYTGTGATPFAIQNITNATSNISLNTLSASYNALDKINQLSEMVSNKQMDFTYGALSERISMKYSIGGTNQYIRYYAPGYDRQESSSGIKEWTYIVAPTGLCGVYHSDNGTNNLYYALGDHLGSPVLLTNSAQSVVEQYSFDSWGRRRNPTDWSFNSVPAVTKMIRGYTLHEMLDEFKMINMNARIYDPVIGRFVQPDNRVTDESDIQTYNIYAYCKNNPLKYTDPSGHEEFNASAYFSYLGTSSTPYYLENLYDPTADINASLNNTQNLMDQQWASTMQSIATSNELANEIMAKFNSGIEQMHNYLQGALNEADQILESNFRKGMTGGGMGLDDFSVLVTEAQRAGFNIDQAIRILQGNSLENSSGYCARFVRWALEAGGLNTSGRPASAKDYGPFLKGLGFNSVNYENYQAKKGDIAVIDAFQGKRNHKHGHIQMYTGTQWISDFRQKSFYPGSDYRNNQPNFTIFRW